MKKLSAVVKASHYNTGKIEVIEAAEDWGLDRDAYLFNVLKYIARAGKKDPNKLIEDLEKAAYYLDRRIQNFRRTKKSGSSSVGERVPSKR